MTQILIFGTSTTYRCWDIEGGWVQRLRKYLDEKQLKNPELYYIIYNLGISGDTSKDILERLDFETKQRLKLLDKGEEVIIIVQVGANDSIINNKTREHHVSIFNYEENVQQIVNVTKKYATKIIFIGHEPINESLVDPIPWLPGHSYLNKHIEEYENKTKEICKKNNIHFTNIFNKNDNNYNDILSPDGAHLNSKGHEKMFEIVRDYLIKNKMI